MVEPISTAVVAEGIAAAAETNALAANAETVLSGVKEIGEVSKEISELTLYEKFDKIREFEEINKSLEFQERFNQVLNEKSTFNKLKTITDDIEARGSIKAKAIRELRKDPTAKGQLGEALSMANKKEFSDIKNQVIYEEGKNKIDLLITTNKNVKFDVLSINQIGEMSNSPLYFKEGEQIAIEVKNCGLNYLLQEIRNGHLLEQIEAGKSIAGNSLVEINMDAFNEMLKDSRISKTIINSIEEAGGNLVLGLPDYQSQIEFLCNRGLA